MSAPITDPAAAPSPEGAAAADTPAPQASETPSPAAPVEPEQSGEDMSEADLREALAKVRKENASWRTKYREIEPLAKAQREAEEAAKTGIDEGFDFLGFHIQRHTQWGSNRKLIYSYPSRRSVVSIRRRIKSVTK